MTWASLKFDFFFDSALLPSKYRAISHIYPSPRILSKGCQVKYLCVQEVLAAAWMKSGAYGMFGWELEEERVVLSRFLSENTPGGSRMEGGYTANHP